MLRSLLGNERERQQQAVYVGEASLPAVRSGTQAVCSGAPADLAESPVHVEWQ